MVGFKRQFNTAKCTSAIEENLTSLREGFPIVGYCIAQQALSTEIKTKTKNRTTFGCK